MDIHMHNPCTVRRIGFADRNSIDFNINTCTEQPVLRFDQRS